MALAYTELTEELGRLQALSSKQTEILRKASQEQASPGEHAKYCESNMLKGWATPTTQMSLRMEGVFRSLT